jgi:hypothetical protein
MAERLSFRTSATETIIKSTKIAVASKESIEQAREEITVTLCVLLKHLLVIIPWLRGSPLVQS